MKYWIQLPAQSHEMDTFLPQRKLFFSKPNLKNGNFYKNYLNMAQWINKGKYFFKWLPDLFLYCGRSCVCGFVFVAEFGSRAFELSNSKKWNSKNFKIPDWLINPGKSLQIQLRAIAYRQIINHGASRTHFWSFKNF